MANADIGSDYVDCSAEFRDRLNNIAAIDTTTKPLTIEYIEGTDSVATIENIRPSQAGALVSSFLCDVITHTAGILEADIVADVDVTPEGEAELRCRVTLPVLPLGASTLGFSLGTARPK